MAAAVAVREATAADVPIGAMAEVVVVMRR